jgi:hypothetical protein
MRPKPARHATTIGPFLLSPVEKKTSSCPRGTAEAMRQPMPAMCGIGMAGAVDVSYPEA